MNGSENAPEPSPFYRLLLDYYRSTPVVWGSVDLFTIGGGDDTAARMGDFGALLSLVGQPDSPLAHISVVWPEPATPDLKAEIVNRATSVLQELGIDAGRAAKTLSRLDVASALSLEMNALLELIGRGAPRTAFVIAHAAVYRSNEVHLALPAVPLREDTWVPHVHALMQSLGPVAGPAECYVVLDAGTNYPTREQNRELLLSVPDSAVFSAAVPSVDGKRVLWERYDQLAATGKVGLAMEELEANDQFAPLQKVLGRIRLLRRAGFTQAVAAELLFAREWFSKLSAEERLALAGDAEFAAQDDLAVELLGLALPELKSREHLELALAVASGTGDEELIRRAEATLVERFPSSPILQRRRAFFLAKDGHFTAAGAEARSAIAVPADLAEYWSWLGENLEAADSVDPKTFRADANQQFPEFKEETTRHIVKHLLSRGREGDVLALLLADGDSAAARLEPAEALGVVKAIYQIAIVHGTVEPQLLETALVQVIRTLARTPSDAGLRVQLTQTLAAEVLGRLGFAIAVRLVLRLSEAPTAPLTNRPNLLRHRPVSADPDAFIERGLAWLGKTPRIVLGTRPFPRELLGISADDALAVLGQSATQLASLAAETGDRAGLDATLALAVAIAPLATDSDEDLVILRLIVSQLAAAGLVQDARDLAEQALALTRGEPGRVRLAWPIFAEAYARSGNLSEALVGMACALAVQPPLSWEEVWHDSILISRLLRDMGLVELARHYVGIARAVVEHLTDDGQLATRLETTDLQLLLALYDRDEPEDPARAREFLKRATANLRAVRALHDEVGPAASVLANAIYIARRHDVVVSSDAEQLLESALESLDPGMRELIVTAAAAVPSPEQVVQFGRRTQPARYRDDVGYDEKRFAAMARRLLASEAAARNPDVAVYAIEAMADHSVEPLGPREPTGTGLRLTATDEGAAEAACEISRGGIAVVLLGGSEAGLRRVVASEGELGDVVTEPPAVFDHTRLSRWMQTYPYGYGGSADGNTFYLSTDGIGVSDLPIRAVVVADAHLQVFPPGLLRIGDELAGRTVRVAAAPSLEWLIAARQIPVERNQRRTAWIPYDPEDPKTLARLADRLAGPLSEHGFALLTNPEPPRHTGGSEIAVVAAHGGVAEQNRYFRVVADDFGAALSSGALASSFGNSAVVVLFVCSGGRVDLRPGANAVVGLVRELLAHGCHAVVAPPWPLETMVPPYWLPPFLNAMDRGANVLDACFEANEAVRRVHGEEPRHWLAMSVYGDPYTSVGGSPT